jgi:SNF2 family DNA or RNA helicase
VFLTTNAGSTGLNLQAANTVINVDLPWNPAVLEQRIALTAWARNNRCRFSF